MKVTHALILSFILIYLVLGFLPTDVSKQIYENYSFSLKGILEGRIWVFLTSIFLHGSPAHLILNCIALFFFGHALEKEITPRKYLAIFFIGAVVGNLTNLLISPASQTIGASGGIFAIMGTAMLISPFEFIIYPYLIPIPLALVGVLYTIYTVIEFLTTKTTNIAYAAHMGGLVTGIVFGLREEESLRGLLIVTLIFLLILFIPVIWKVFSIANYVRVIHHIFT